MRENIKAIFIAGQRRALFLTILWPCLALGITALSAPLSEAKIHIEPYAGWSWTATSSKPLIKQNVDKLSSAYSFLSKGRYYQGPSPGMRLGYSSLGLAVGIDMAFGYWSSLYKEDWTSFKNKEQIMPLLPGLFVSYKLPLLFRVYASLIPQASIQFTSAEENSWCHQSRGAKFGMSYMSLPFVSINFEYMPLYIGGENCQTWAHTGTVYANFIF